MWFRGVSWTIVVLVLKEFSCNAITNAEFNEQIRGYSVVENVGNISEVKTLQKQGVSQYTDTVPLQNVIKFKDTNDNAVSGSSHSRGFVQGHTGYGFDYEDPGFGQHGYEYPLHEGHHDVQDYHHHHDPGHRYPVHHGHGHPKYYDHGLAHKALLWPLAGIALLGAAAALVSNPVLLQLGVVSGKRRRRQIEDIDDITKNSIHKWSQSTGNYGEDDENIAHTVVKKRMLRKNDIEVGKRVLQTSIGDADELQFESVSEPNKQSEEDRRFIPIPLKIRKS